MKRTTQPYEYNGYRGLSAIAKAYQIPLGTLKGRINRGLTLEEALSNKDFRDSNGGTPIYEWNGIRGISAIAKKVGISEMAIYVHLRKGEDITQAISSILATKAKVAKAKKAPRPKVQHVGIKKPDMMNNTWRLALGVSA